VGCARPAAIVRELHRGCDHGIGVSAAIANAVFHATGQHIRSLPITIDKYL